MPTYPKRLIEVDLPIKRISAHARREKSIRHGHISTLHIWWARRPLAACRAVICAALWPDPADPLCPAAFVTAARAEMQKWTSHQRQELLSPESRERFEKARQKPTLFKDPIQLRGALLDFIADFANWDNSTVKVYLETSRLLTAVAHNSLTDPHFKLPPEGPNFLSTLSAQLSTAAKPLVVDPFCGGGSIPLEALRVGADAFASDLNPIPVLLNKVVLEYIPRFANNEIRIPKSEWSRRRGNESLTEKEKNEPPHVGSYDEKTGDLVLHGLADAVRFWGEWIKQEAEKELADFYPKDPDGATPIAYLWARTIQCEGPGCGAEVPLIRSLWLAKKSNRSAALQLVPRLRAKRVDFQIITKQRSGWVSQYDSKDIISDPKFDGTVKRGSVTCPCCGYTTPVTRVREQLKKRRGGATDARLLAVVTTREGEQGRFYRCPTEADTRAEKRAEKELDERIQRHKGLVSLVPDEPLPLMSGVFNVPIYGHNTWGSLFTPRQALTLSTLARLVVACGKKLEAEMDVGLSKAVKTCLALVMDRQANTLTALSRWHTIGEKIEGVFSRQALGMVWDFAEANSFSGATGDLDGALEWVQKVCNTVSPANSHEGHVERASATQHPLPDDSASAFVTDPPYYNAVPYADLSDFFYVWLKRTLASDYEDLFSTKLSPKDEEACEMAGWDPVRYPHKNARWFESQMRKAMAEGRRVLSPDGIGIVVFAHKSTTGWEAQLQAMIDAGWITTGSWPIDTEMGTRLRARDSAALASSVHLVCRPRENPDGSVRTDDVGDWRDVLAELPRRIHAWMPRLADEGVVGADAIFACLGPALEIFSRYSRVEKADGEAVLLKEYLEHVWAAVAKEALEMIFSGADATGFEEDARLTAMWLWTRKTGDANGTIAEPGEDDFGDDQEGNGNKGSAGGFVLEYDAARKIAQGLGAHLEDLASLVAVEGETARLLPVAERAQALFGKDEGKAAPSRRKREPQLDMFKAMQQSDESGEATFGETKVERVGSTVLDRIHQSMILFAAGRSEALKRFLVEDGVGADQRFWRLAQALSALYPAGTDEKRWVDGVLARKKGLGF